MATRLQLCHVAATTTAAAPTAAAADAAAIDAIAATAVIAVIAAIDGIAALDAIAAIDGIAATASLHIHHFLGVLEAPLSVLRSDKCPFIAWDRWNRLQPHFNRKSTQSFLPNISSLLPFLNRQTHPSFRCSFGVRLNGIVIFKSILSGKNPIPIFAARGAAADFPKNATTGRRFSFRCCLPVETSEMEWMRRS